jgi:hypothetical protein
MIKFTDYIDPLSFFIALFIGLFFTYIYYKPRKIIIQWPTPENAGKIVYKNENDENCYAYKASEIDC